MCQCTPNIRTPFCGRGNCQWPEQKEKMDVRKCFVLKEVEIPFEELFVGDVFRTEGENGNQDFAVVTSIIRDRMTGNFHMHSTPAFATRFRK